MSFQRLLVPLFLALGIAAAFIREIVFAHYYGVSDEMDMFRLAFALPNLLSQSVAPAFLGAVIPMIVSSKKEHVSGISSRILHVNLIGTVSVAAFGFLFAGFIAKWLAPGFSIGQVDQLTGQLRIAMLFFLFFSVTFGLRAILNAREVFWPSASSAFVVSLVFIIGCVGVEIVVETPVWTATFLMKTAVCAAFTVLVLHLIPARREVAQYFSRKSWVESGSAITMRSIATAIGLVVIYKISFTFPRILDRAFATDIGPGVISALDYSFGILNVPGILLATSVITLAFPQFSRMVSGEFDRASVRNYIRLLVLVVGAAVAIGFICSSLASTIIKLVYQRGSFDQLAASTTTELFKWHGIGLGPMVANLILSQVLFAFRAFKLALAIVFVRVVAKVIALKFMVPQMGLAGLGASFVLAEVVTLFGLSIAAVWLVRQRTAET